MTGTRVALVTGGAGGLGVAISEALARDGMRLALCDLDGTACAQLAATLPGEGHAGVAVDVSDETSVLRGFDEVERRLGPVGVLVACAGIQRPRGGTGFATPGAGGALLPTAETSLEAWNRTMAVNATGLFLSAREFVRRLPQDCRDGRIVTFSSVAARYGSIMSGIDYVATKAAIIGMTKTLANELAPRGVTVNCIAPGLIDTAMFRSSVRREDDAAVSKSVPLGYIGTPADIAAAVRFLVSPEARYITGMTVDVNGGMRME